MEILEGGTGTTLSIPQTMDTSHKALSVIGLCAGSCDEGHENIYY